MPADSTRTTVEVARSLGSAFERFTRDITSWWPLATHSVGQARAQTVVFEEREGGRIYERLKDGGELVWGTVSAWDPPRHVAFTWHPGRESAEAEHVDVRFEPTEKGTRVTLTHDGWKHLGAEAPASMERLKTGWEPVLGRFAAEEEETERPP